MNAIEKLKALLEEATCAPWANGEERAQFTEALPLLLRVVEAADKLTKRLADEPLEFVTSRGKHNIEQLQVRLRAYDQARADLESAMKGAK